MEDPEELGWCRSMYGPEDTFGEEPRLESATPEELRLRTERQTLRRLPMSGAIVFTIRVYVSQLALEGRLASAVRSWPADVAAYKWGTAVVAEYLRKNDAMDIKQGQTGMGRI